MRGEIATMRQLRFVVGLILIALAVVAGRGAPAAVSAQAGTATPTAGFIGLPEGISAWRVSEFTQAPSLYRFQFEPGARLPGYADETVVLAYVERGTVTLRSDGHLSISRLESSDPPRITDPGAETVSRRASTSSSPGARRPKSGTTARRSPGFSSR